MNEWGKRLSEQFRAGPARRFLDRWTQRSEGSIRSSTPERRVLIAGKWFVGEPALNIAGKFSRRAVAVLSLEGHRLEDDRLQLRRYGRADLTRRKELSLADLA